MNVLYSHHDGNVPSADSILSMPLSCAPGTSQENSTVTKSHPSNQDSIEKKCSVHKAKKSMTKKQTRTRKWPEGKPKRPLTAYNFFFHHERERIIKANSSTLDVSNTTNRRRSTSTGTGFAGLARSVAEKWKKLDNAEKSIFQAQADSDKRRYVSEVEAWKTECQLAQMNSCISNTTTANSTVSLHQPIPSFHQRMSNNTDAAFRDLEKTVGQMFLSMNQRINEELLQMLMHCNNMNVEIPTSTTNSQANIDDRNLNEIQPDNFEPTPIALMSANNGGLAPVDGHNVRAANFVRSDCIIERGMPAGPNTCGSNCNGNIENSEEIADKWFMELLRTFEE